MRRVIPPLRDWPIERKLALLVMAASGLASVLAFGGFFLYEFVRFRQTAQEELSSLANVIGQNSRAALAFEDSDAASETLQGLGADARILSAALYAKDGRLFASYRRDPSLSSAVPPNLFQAKQRVDGNVLTVMAPIELDGDFVGALLIHSDTTEMDRRIWRYCQISVLVLAGAFLVAFLVSARLKKLISGPILHLVQTANAVSIEQNFQIRAQKTGRDELGMLVDAFNKMLGEIYNRDLELQQHRDRLEEQVNTRTAELQTVNRELRTAKEKAEAAARAKSQFLATMSHEIRTPMNGVIGMAALLAESDLNVEQRDYAETIQQSANSLLIIINDILDFSKIEAGKVQYENVDFDLARVLDGVVALLNVKAEEKGIRLTVEAMLNVPRDVRGDPARLRQILLNLTGNAIKFTSTGQVTVRAGLERDEGTCAVIRFAVIDTGIGIPAAARERLFEAFTQVDSGTSRQYGGTGLGLAISKRLVEGMGGEIGLESEEGRGSTFWFTLPLGKGEMEDLTVVHLRGLQVLLAGADSVEHKILDQNLSLWGVVSHSAPNLRAALGKMRAAVEQRHPFDVVLADWDMAADGNQLGHEFRKACESTGAALVLLNQALSSESPEAPGASVPSLTKPVMASELFNCLIGLAQTRKPPSIRVAPLGQMAAPAAVNKKTSGRALVVEDNLVNQRVASRLLQKLGWSADVAAGGREALEWLERNQYDLVLMDCQMPEMDGFQTTAEIRRRESPGQRIPIIALTANAMEGDREKCLKAGMDDYLSKPVRPQTLAETVARWSSKVQVGQPASSEPGPT